MVQGKLGNASVASGQGHQNAKEDFAAGVHHQLIDSV